MIAIALTIVGVLALVALTCGVLATLTEAVAASWRGALMIALAVVAFAMLKWLGHGAAYVAIAIIGGIGAWDLYQRATHSGEYSRRKQ